MNNAAILTNDTAPPGGRLLRILGVGFGVAIGVGATIGSGVLRTPGEVAAQMGGAAATLAVWLFGGLYALIGSTVVIELATMLPRAGGWYVYSERAFGGRVGFSVGCCDWVNQVLGAGAAAAAIGEFTAELVPPLSAHLVAVSLIALTIFGTLNLLGLKSGSRTQIITSAIKALAFISLIVGCFTISDGQSPLAQAANPIVPAPARWLGYVFAFQAVVFTYDAWYSAMYFSEEDTNPGRNLPRSMAGTLISCVATFLLLNVALMYGLGFAGLEHSRDPAADVSLLIFGHLGRRIFLCIALLTAVSNLNSSLLMAPRVALAMARDRALPSIMGMVTPAGAPAVALIVSLAIGVALVLSGTFEDLVAIDAVLIVAIYISGYLAQLTLRHREPSLGRPFRAWRYPWTSVIALAVSLGFLALAVIGDLAHSLLTIILIVASYVASRWIVRARDPTVHPAML